MKRGVKLPLLWFAKAFGLFRMARFLTRKGFVIIGWHGVSLRGEHLRLPSYCVTQDQLAQRLAWLNRHYRIVSLKDAIAQHRSGQLLPRQAVLTFDDGMFSFQEAALPILRRLGLPATLYVVSSTLHHDCRCYPLLIRDLFQLTRKAEWRGPGEVRTGSHELSGPVRREQAAETAVGYFRTLPTEADRDKFVKQLAGELEVDLSGLEHQRTWHYLTSDELRCLAHEDVDIQAHSHVHINCVDDLHLVFADTLKCRSMIECVTGTEVVHYCYPSGFWCREVWPELERAGIVSAVTCNTGPNYASTPALALRRFIDHHRVDQLEFEFAVSGLRWLIHRMVHPFRSQTPMEKRANPGPFF